MSPVIPADDPSIYEALRTLVLSGQNLALLSPANPPGGLSGFLFDIDLEQSMSLESTITEHYVEDAQETTDHIALRPESLVLSGLVAEVVQYKKEASAPAPALLSLKPAPGLSGDMSLGESQLRFSAASRSTLFTQAKTAEAGNSLFKFYGNRLPQQPNQSRQSMVANYFYQLWKGRMLCTVDTPFGLMTDMAIMNISGGQSGETRWSSEFSITLKKIRKVTEGKVWQSIL